MRHPIFRAFVAASLFVAVGCGPADTGDGIVIDTSNGNGTTSGGDPTQCDDCQAGEFETELAFCVEFINELRSQVDRPPLVRSAALEECAAGAAQEDAQNGTPHGHFRRTRGCDLTATAENEVPGWPLERYESVQAIVQAGAESMFAEGPGGGHYENIVGDHTTVGCGIHVTENDAVWVVHNFK
jgi:hypothetical protein